SADFFDLFYQEKFEEIYRGSTDIFKSAATEEQSNEMLSLADSMRGNANYRIFKHAFFIRPDYGALITINFIAETDERDLYLSLTYLGEPGNHKIAGIHLNEIKKK
ncbi:MAG: hypothetical protein AAGI38_15985, partial [Bacteroidota bacterium]